MKLRGFARGGLTLRRPRFDWFTLSLAVLGLLGAALVLLRQANYGVGMGGDSTLYIATARSLLEGNWFVSPWGVRYENAAPLFPLSLAFAGLFGVDAIAAAGYMNAAAFGLTVFATGMWLRSRVRSLFLVAWAGCACVLSLRLAHSSAQAMTEALFILFIVLALFALDRFLDTRKRSLLLLAAVCAALACLTRYLGVTLVASALLLLLLQRGATFPERIKSVAIYSVIAITPIGLWMLRNLLNSGTLAGEATPTDFSLLSSIHNAGSEFSKWTFGHGGFRLLDLGTSKIFGVSIRGDPAIAAVFLKIAVLLALAVAVGYALIWLRRRGYAQNWGILTVPVVFILVYALAVAVSLPLTDVDLPIRYLAPIYPPLLVAAALTLNQFLRWAEVQKPLAALPFLQKWNASLTKRMTISLPAIILVAGLSLWLAQQVYANYYNIKGWMDDGAGYTSREWTGSETMAQYLRSHPPDGHIWTNTTLALYSLTGINGDRISAIGTRGGTMQPDKRHLRFDDAHTDAKDVYFVLFRRGFQSDAAYEDGLTQIAALPGTETVAKLEDGVVLKIVRNPSDDAGIMDEGALLQAGLPKEAQPPIRSIFNVYLDEQENRLIYARDDCSDDDIEPPFFLHVVPVDPANLSEHSQQYIFDHLDFNFDDYGLRSDGLCVATRNLPVYDIASIMTGQYLPGEYRIWRGDFNLADE